MGREGWGRAGWVGAGREWKQTAATEKEAIIEQQTNTVRRVLDSNLGLSDE